MSIEGKDHYVTFLFGTKFHYVMPLFLFGVSVFTGLNLFFDLSSVYVILFAFIMLPMIIVSAKSKVEQHKFEILKDSIRIGIKVIEGDSLQKIVIYEPITIYFYIKKLEDDKGKKIEAIQIKREESASIFTQISKWARDNNIEIIKN